VPCEKEGDGFAGLEMGLELPLLKGLFRLKGLRFYGLGAVLLSFVALSCEQACKPH